MEEQLARVWLLPLLYNHPKLALPFKLFYLPSLSVLIPLKNQEEVLEYLIQL